MTSADAIDQEIINEHFKHNCRTCNHFRSDLNNKHNGLCTLGDFPVSWKDEDDDCPDFSRE